MTRVGVCESEQLVVDDLRAPADADPEAVARAMPDCETRKVRLAKIGAQLWLG